MDQKVLWWYRNLVGPQHFAIQGYPLDGLELPPFDLSALSPRRVLSGLKSRLLP